MEKKNPQPISPRIYLSPPHMGPEERHLLLDAFDSNWVAPLGPHVDAFEREMAAYIGVPAAAALSSGTAALHLALLMLGVQRGDDVFVSSLTFAATANAISYCGANPVFIDASSDTWTMDPARLAEALQDARRRNKMPKAVIPVDLYGQCADYDAIGKLCADADVPIIEDAAEGLGATYGQAKAGSFGTMAILSFNGNKIITTSGGGMLLSNNPNWIERARFLATQARDPAAHYQHTTIGYNYRMSNLLAAVGRGQLRVLGDRVAKRRANYAAYTAALAQLPGIAFMKEAAYGTCTHWLTCLTVDEKKFGASRETIRVALEAENIEARPVWKPMHLQPVFADCRSYGGDVSAHLFENGLCVPSGSSLTAEELSRVVQIIKRCHFKD